MNDSIQIIDRGRGKVLLSSGRQYYRHVSYKNGTSLWRCKESKTTKKCAGSVTINTVSQLLFFPISRLLSSASSTSYDP